MRLRSPSTSLRDRERLSVVVTELLRLNTVFDPDAQASVGAVLSLLLLDPALSEADRQLIVALSGTPSASS